MNMGPSSDSIQADPLRSAFAPLIGLPASSVRRGHGSFLTLEFRKPRLIIREPQIPSPGVSETVAAPTRRRLVAPKREWHLWIYCCHWRVLSHDKEIAWSEATDVEIGAAVRELDGQRIAAVEAETAEGTSVFSFDRGATLQTWPYGKGDDIQWHLYMPSGDVFSYREDGFYRLGPGNERPSEMVWQPLRRHTTG